jgi:enoyl-[acyl-carrier-protein] reductase (NADH)
MVKQGSGVILTLSTPGSRMSGQGFLGYGVTLAEVANVAAFVASDRARAMTGTVANVACGSIVD